MQNQKSIASSSVFLLFPIAPSQVFLFSLPLLFIKTGGGRKGGRDERKEEGGRGEEMNGGERDEEMKG